MKILVTLSWVGVLGGCGLGAFVLVTGMATATGAPQEAVVICLAMALAIIPYCGARALTTIYTIDDIKKDAPPTVKKQETGVQFNYQGIGIRDK